MVQKLGSTQPTGRRRWWPAASGAKSTGNRITPILAEASMSDANSHWRLAALVFVDLDQPRDLLDIGPGEAGGDDVLAALIIFHVTFQDAIQYLVGRQTVLISLVGP